MSRDAGIPVKLATEFILDRYEYDSVVQSFQTSSILITSGAVKGELNINKYIVYSKCFAYSI